MYYHLMFQPQHEQVIKSWNFVFNKFVFSAIDSISRTYESIAKLLKVLSLYKCFMPEDL